MTTTDHASTAVDTRPATGGGTPSPSTGHSPDPGSDPGSGSRSSPASGAASGGSPGPALFTALLGFALITLDSSVVNVALPAIGADLRTGMAGLQWVVDAYTLAFAALLLSSGALADRIGASRAYAAGVVGFTLASVACGLAPGLLALLAARTVQGMAAAVMLPASLALVREAYGDPARRARAVSLWAAGGTVAVALGPVVGGALTTAWSWRGIFFVNLPLGLLALALPTRVGGGAVQGAQRGGDGRVGEGGGPAGGPVGAFGQPPGAQQREQQGVEERGHDRVGSGQRLGEFGAEPGWPGASAPGCGTARRRR